MKLPWILVLILTAGIILLILLWPELSKPNYEGYENQIAIQNIKIDSLTAANAKLSQKIKQDSARQANERQQYKSTIEKQSVVISDLKANPRVVEIRSHEPEVNALIIEMERMDSVKTERIARLENDKDALRIDMRQMESNFGELLQAEREKFNAQKEISDELTKDLKKAKRANRVWKVATVVGVVGAFLLAK